MDEVRAKFAANPEATISFCVADKTPLGRVFARGLKNAARSAEVARDQHAAGRIARHATHECCQCWPTSSIVADWVPAIRQRDSATHADTATDAGVRNLRNARGDDSTAAGTEGADHEVIGVVVVVAVGERATNVQRGGGLIRKDCAHFPV
jgi:hypothetical protein